jgi:hypothetical protein
MALVIALVVTSCSEDGSKSGTRSASTTVSDYFGEWRNADASFSICDYKFQATNLPRNVAYVNENGSAPDGHVKPDRSQLITLEGQVLTRAFGSDEDFEGVELTVFVSDVRPETPEVSSNFDLIAQGRGSTATLSLRYGDPESVSLFTFHRVSAACSLTPGPELRGASPSVAP